MSKTQISTLSDGIHAVGGVVGLRVSKQGHKIRYLMRWTRHGVRHDYYLPRDISLTEARKLGAECRYQLDRGEDPRVEHKRREVEAIEKLHKLDAQKSVYLTIWIKIRSKRLLKEQKNFSQGFLASLMMKLF